VPVSWARVSSQDPISDEEPRRLGRYTLCAELATGGMATVYLARMEGAGFGKIVAIKRLHPHFARDPDVVAMFVDEARLAARVTHTNVVSTLDVVAAEGELSLVLSYVPGESLSRLLKASHPKPPPVAVTVAILIDVLNGLHAAHEATDEDGKPLSLVHRDVSPQNVLVGTDGVARVIDFGIAKAVSRLQTTHEGQLKGKLPYMAPEQLTGSATRLTDIYAASVVLWEALCCERLFRGRTEREIVEQIGRARIAAPSEVNAAVTPELDRIVAKGLERDPRDRFGSALEMAHALDGALRPASTNQVAEWLEVTAGPQLRERVALVAEIERSVDKDPPSFIRRLAEEKSAPSLPAEERTKTDRTRTLAPPMDRSPRVQSGKSRAVILAGASMASLVLVALATLALPRSRVEVRASSAPVGPRPSAAALDAGVAAVAAPSETAAASIPAAISPAPSAPPPRPTVTVPRPGPTSRPRSQAPSPGASSGGARVKSPEDILNSPTILDQH
jgi:eukaryotic-like serine/threonine-protein kinase